MARKLWLIVALAVLCAVAAVLLTQTPPPAPVTVPATRADAAVNHAPTATTPVATPAVAAAPASADAVQEPRPSAGYDRYKREIERVRAARREAQDLKVNERCIDGQRFRKVGTEWEQAGTC